MDTFIIGIGGPSCAGKTRLAIALKEALAPRGSALLSMDSYYRDLSDRPAVERARFNFDAPEAIEHDLLVDHLQRLARGQRIRKPVYDFATHCRAPRWEWVDPAAFVIVEGLLALCWEPLRALMGLKVFLAVEEATSLERRLRRDVTERARTPESVSRQYAETVQPMYALHVAPTRAHADLVLDGTQDPRALVSAVLAWIKQNAG